MRINGHKVAVKMNPKKIIKYLSEVIPTQVVSNNILVALDYEHIISGIAIEKTRTHFYIYSFVYPLFDSSEHLHLLYSTRIGQILVADATNNMMSPASLAKQVMKIADSADRNLFTQMTLDDFKVYIETTPGLLQNPHSQFIYACTNVLLGKLEVVQRFLIMSQKKLHNSKIQLCETVLSFLPDNLASATDCIISEEQFLKTKLQIGRARN